MFTLASEHSRTSNNLFLLYMLNMERNFSKSSKRQATSEMNVDALKQLAQMFPWTRAMDHVA